MYPYFEDSRHSSGQGVPPFLWNEFTFDATFRVPRCGNIEVVPLLVRHGKDHSPKRQPYHNVGFRIGSDLSYIGDVSGVPETTRELLAGTKILILNALRDTPQPPHFSFPEVYFPLVEVR